MTQNKIHIDIKKMSEPDIERLMEIEREVFPDPWPEEAFRDGLMHPSHHFIVAQADNKIAGYAAYFLNFHEARLTNIAVALEYQRKSIAKKLLKYILDIVKKTDCYYIFLDVRPSNQAAIDLYRNFGFEKAYIRPDYYDNPPEDAMVMVRRLDKSS